MTSEGLRFPQAAILELTYRCNHRCMFCSCPWEAPSCGYEKGTELTLEEWRKAIDRLQTLGVKTLSISGGEALLKDCLADILAYIRKKDCFNKDISIVLISNGLAMSQSFLEAFKKYNVHLSLSLPGLDTFARHTGVDNAEGVLHWLAEAKKMGLETTENVTVTDINYHELYETLAEGLLAGADTVLLNRFLPGGRGLSHAEELSLNIEQLNGMLDTAEEVLSLSGRNGSVGTEFPRCIIREPEKYKHLRVASVCAAAKEFFVIDPSGRVRTCNHSPRVVGHILRTPVISDIDYWNIFAQRRYIPASCVSCHDVNYCDCGCREAAAIVHGDVCAKDVCFNEKLGVRN